MGKRIALLLCVCIFLVGCTGGQEEKVDLSAYNFVGVEWTRSTEYCTETLYLRDNGDISYYCACGEPVNDDDLCEGYRYDPETKTVYLDFVETVQGTVTQFVVKSCDGQTLVLDFAGEERVFQKEENQEDELPEREWLDEMKHEGKTYRYLQFPGDIFYYDLRESVNYEEDMVLPIPHETWDLVYREGDLFVVDTQWDAAVADYAEDANYTWSIWIDMPGTESGTDFPITVTEDDLAYLYSMEDRKGDTSYFFKDIEVFGMLTKTHQDGLIAGSTSLARCDGVWYWRSETIDERVEGWPEFMVRLPDSITAQLPNI